MGGRTEVAVLGAGFGGLAVAHRLAESGVDDLVIFERGDGVGGTWRANTYPGAACDIPSHLYSLSFAPNPNWSSAYASQPEILAYLEACYDRFDVRRKVRCGTEIIEARWRDDLDEWVLRDRAGEEHRARFVVSAIGLFHTPSIPAIPGAEEFGGAAFHSARWDHGHDLTGERVAVIGTGASAIQIVPAIAERVEHLDVYQRTPPWVMPRKNEPFTTEQQRRFAEDPDEAARIRRELDELHEQATAFVTGDPRLDALAALALSYLERKVADDELRARLTPRTLFGCTRTLISSDYFPAVQRDDVEVVVEGIERITPSGIRTVDGRERPCDTIVWCTGFDAHDYLKGITVTGRGGLSIQEVWGDVPRAYHGMAVPAFPNFFLLYGPNTNQGGNSIILILEAQAKVVARAVGAVREAGAARIEVRDDAMTRYVEELEAALGKTVWASGCTTYFHTASGAIVTQLPHTAGWYRSTTDDIEWSDFALIPDTSI